MTITLQSLAASLDQIGQNLHDIKGEQAKIQQDLSVLKDSAVKKDEFEDLLVAAAARAEQRAQPEVSEADVSGQHGLEQSQQQTPQQSVRSSSAPFAENTSTLLGRIARPQDAPSPIQGAESAPTLNAAEIQREYDIIKDSLQKVRLPPNTRVYDSKAGIKKECQASLSIVSKCARYTETAIKQLGVILQEHDSGRQPTLEHSFSVRLGHFRVGESSLSAR